MRALAVAAAVFAASLVLAASASSADTAPWQAAANVQQALSDAQADLVLGDAAAARARLAATESDVERLLGTSPAAGTAVVRAEQAAAIGDEPALAAARSELWTAILAKAFAEMTELQWFLTEQVEEEKSAREIVAKFRLVGNDPASLLDLDRELGSRTGA